MFRRLKNDYANQTLHQKIRLSILVFALPPLLCLFGISLSLIYRNRISAVQESVYAEFQERFSDMDYNMRTIEMMSNTVWSDTTFIAEVGRAVVNEDFGEFDRYMFQNYTLSTLKVINSIGNVRGARIYLDYPGLKEYSSYLYSMDRAKGNLWYDDRENLTYSGAWYMDVADKTSYGTYADYFVDENMASFVIPIRIASNLAGVFEIVTPMNSLAGDLFRNMPEQDVFLADSQNRLLGMEPDEFGTVTAGDLAGLMGIASLQDYDTEGVQVYHGFWRHIPVILTVAKERRSGILLMQLTSMKNRYLEAICEAAVILALEILLLAILIRVIDRIVNHLLRDFEVFSGCIRKVGEGNMDVVIPRLEQVEINAVAVEYNRMLDRMKQLMEISIQREVMVKEAQLKSLEKQINSHFLYNVLDSIKMMAEVRGIYNVSDALLALGKMFRYNLQIDEHIIMLQEEISYLENYIKLCNIRYDYYISLNENVSEEMRKLKVPKVILQPIAENSIIYGLDEMAEDTAIYLKAYMEGECAYIEMTDMGRGMDEETLQSVRQGIVNGRGGEHSTNGIGLYNIHQRLRLMYGEPYGVEIYSKEGCYTKVVLKIRADRKEEPVTIAETDRRDDREKDTAGRG